MRLYRILTILSLLVLLAVCVLYVWQQQQTKGLYMPRAEFLIDKGNSEQTVTAFIDYRCGNCGAFYKALADLKELRPELTLIIRPLAFIDQQSVRLTQLALAAGTEGHFNEIHIAFLERNGAFDDAFLRETLSLYGLDLAELEKKSQSGHVQELFMDNTDDATLLGVNLIPSLLIGNTYYVPPAPIENFSVSDILPLLAPAQ